MCIICCCPSGRTCTFIAAIATGIEAGFMSILNLLIILACSCNIKPSNSAHLSTDFMEQVWSWFIYDGDKCLAKDVDFVRPKWIVNVPDYFKDAPSYNLVEQSSNYIYQIIYFNINILWFASCFLLFLGNATRHFHYYFPWLILCAITITLDTIFGSFYIRFMDDTNPGWEDGRAIFSMQFLYYRGFLIYLYNVAAFVIVSFTCFEMYRKYRREKKLLKKAARLAQPSVNIAPPHTQGQHYDQRFYQQNILVSDAPGAASAMGMNDNQQSNIERHPAPSKYRPFSYTNPAYRPNDPHDVEGMKMNAAVDEYTKGLSDNRSYDDIENMGTKIPRISLQKK